MAKTSTASFRFRLMASTSCSPRMMRNSKPASGSGKYQRTALCGSFHQRTGGYLATTFSPDGELVYYVATLERNKFVPTLYRVPVLGGTPAKVLDRVFSAIAFSRDGKQFAFVRRNQDDMALMVANTDGSGEPRTIAVLKQPNGFSTSGPSWSPDGKRIANGMFNASGAGYSTVVEVPVEGGEPRPIGSEKWASVGRLLWLEDSSGLIMTAQPEFSSIGTQVWFLPYRGGPAHRITNDLNGYGEVSLGLTADSGTIATIQQVNASSIWITSPNEDESRARQVLKTNLPETVAWTSGWENCLCESHRRELGSLDG